ncbi:MAG TPA: DinB family protein [Thermoanaerobaculia bacterium]|nr:DinB family protein [Thermoanaerobaculia bacterium]
MNRPHIARPLEDEYAPAMQAYLDDVEGDDLFGTLAAQLREIDARFASLGDERALHRYAPDKWSVKEVLTHVADGERVFAYRALCIARGDETPLPAFDEQLYAAASMADHRPLAGILRELRALREATIALLESLDEEALSRRGIANARVVSTRALGWILAGHFAHHMRVLRERYGVE